MELQEIVQRVNAVTWFHKFEIVPGVVTPGLDDTETKWKLFEMPESFEGKRVLDIGCNSGYFSFEAERRGAVDGVAIDIGPPEGTGFSLVSEIRGSKVEFVEASVYEVTPERFGTFDIVFFLGVLYHLRHPMLALDRIYEVCQECMILETHVSDGEVTEFKTIPHVPIMRFYPADELVGDPSNWWGPNVACVEKMMEVSRFRPERIKSWGGNRAAYRAYKLDTPISPYVEIS